VTIWYSADEVAIDVGRLSAVASRLHSVLGSGALRCEDPSLTVLVDEWSLYFAEHAMALFDRLPLRAGFDRASVVHVGAYGPALALIDQRSQEGEELFFFAGFVTGVLPVLRRDAAALAQRTGDIAEKSLRRSLAFFALDLEAMAVAGADRLSQLTTHAGSRALVNSLPSTLPEITLRARRLA
jgi:hypothetical protein